MNMELIKSLKKIGTNKELLSKIENFDYSFEDLYKICKKYGFTGSFEEFEKDYEELFSKCMNEINKQKLSSTPGFMNEMNEEELSSVAGGKMNKFFSRSTAALLSALTLSTTAMPKSSASNISNEKPSISSRLINFANKHPLKFAAAGIGAEILGLETTVLVGASAVYAVYKANHAIKNYRRTQCLEKLINKYDPNTALEKFISTDLGTSACPFPEDAETISTDLIAMYSKRDINESIAQYIYKIYNSGKVGMQTISEGLTHAARESKDKSVGLNSSVCYKIADIIDFIRTSKGIPEDQRETKFSQFLTNFEKIGDSFEVDKIKAIITEDEMDLSLAKNHVHQVNIDMGITFERLEKKHIDTKKVFENFIKSGIIVNEKDKIGKSGKIISKYSIDKYVKWHSDSDRNIYFLAKNPSCEDVTFTFPQNNGWSQEFKVYQKDKYCINEGLGLVCHFYDYGHTYSLKTAEDAMEDIEDDNTEDAKEMRNILNELIKTEKNSRRTQYLENLKKDNSNTALKKFINTDLGTPVCPFPEDAESISNDLIAMYSKRDMYESIAKYIYKIYNEGNVDMQTISKGLELASEKLRNGTLLTNNYFACFSIARIIDFIRTSEDIPENQRETKFNYFLNNFSKIGNSTTLFNKIGVIEAFIRDEKDLSIASKKTYRVYINLEGKTLEEKNHIDIKKINENFVKSGIIVNEKDKIGNTISSCPIDKYEKFSGVDKCDIYFVAKNPSCEDVTFTFPKNNGWSREFKIFKYFKYYINKDLGLVCYYHGNNYYLKTAEDVMKDIEGYNTEDAKEMLNILKEIKK